MEQTEPLEADMTEETAAARKWFGVIAPEGVKSGDKRMFAPGALRMRSLPLPLTWQKISGEGHKGAVTVASINETWREQGLIWGAGEWMDTPEADEAFALVEHFGRYGVSIDADDLDEFSIEMLEDGTTVFTDARQCSACIVSIPAFAEAFVMNGDHAQFKADFAGGWGAPSQPIPERENEGQDECEERDEEGNCVEREPDAERKEMALGFVEGEPAEGEEEPCDPENDPDCVAREESLPEQETPPYAGVSTVETTDVYLQMADLAPGLTEDGPGWVTHPVDTDRLRDWVVRDPEGIFQWGVPDDFYRCEAWATQYVKPQYVKGYCANRHYDALGYWPGQAPHQGEAIEMMINGIEVGTEEPTVEGASLTASAPMKDPPRIWFEDPGLPGVTPLTVTNEGRVFGHLATWGQCHIGFKGECVLLPKSKADYSYFHIGVVDTTEGQVAVGPLMIGGKHAPGRMNWRNATAHYDTTSAVVADIRVGEDEHGVWMSGALRDIDDGQVRELKAAGKASGDWREVVRGSRQLELVAALTVNVGGYPVPRTEIAVSDGRVVSLVAAAIVEDDPIADITNEVIARLAAREEMARLRREEYGAEMAALAEGIDD